MVDDSVLAVVQKPRRIPFNLLDRAERKICNLLEQDTIERVPDNQPRSWVIPPMIAPKPGSNDIRSCIDMRMANEAIQRPYTQILTMADVINKQCVVWKSFFFGDSGENRTKKSDGM